MLCAGHSCGARGDGSEQPREGHLRQAFSTMCTEPQKKLREKKEAISEESRDQRPQSSRDEKARTELPSLLLAPLLLVPVLRGRLHFLSLNL